jgi:GTPase SAR1 family protein
MMNRVLVAGMPSAGKSTYIAALRHALVAKDVSCVLELIGLSQEEAHLNRLELAWVDGKQMQRTQSANETWVELQIRDRATQESVVLALPDLKGESFEQPATLGILQAELQRELHSASSVMLFTSADREDDKLLISDIADILDDETEDVEAPATPFDAREMPEEVKIVELLQFANKRPLSGRNRKLALIVSAWDVVDAQKHVEPERWLTANRAMLDQFLRYNSNLWDVRVYGVSAQGGRLPEDRDRLMKLSKPSERIQVVGHGADRHDITAPLRWLIASRLDP